MMKQRTLNIIYICKGNTKYWNGVRKDHDLYDAIRNYMADECAFKAKWYSDADISKFLFEAMTDYLDHCDKPSFFMECLTDVMDRRGHDMYYSIALVFRAYTQVMDDDGNYVNGFDDRIHALDKESMKDKKAEMIIDNLRHRGASKYDIEAEISHRNDNVVPNDEKCFAYKTEELELALKHWEEY